MQQNDFYGLSQQVRWIGVIEDNKDPSQLGRCKVRIIGWYSDDKNLAPTVCLPWAQAQFSPGIKSFTAPKVGEWVTGYFLDGKMAQYPVYDGILPGVNYKLTDPIPGAPRPPLGVRLEQGDTPSTPRLARGELAGSLIDQANQNLAHVCDESIAIRINAGFEKLKNSQLMVAIREKIKALIKTLNGTDQSGLVTFAKNLLIKLKGAIQYALGIINEIVDFTKLAQEIYSTVKSIVDYILNLPAKLLKELRGCISVVLAGVSSLFAGVTSEIDLPDTSEITELFKDTQNTIQNATEAVNDSIGTISAAATEVPEFVPGEKLIELNSFNSGMAPGGA